MLSLLFACYLCQSAIPPSAGEQANQIRNSIYQNALGNQYYQDYRAYPPVRVYSRERAVRVVRPRYARPVR